MDGEQIGDFLSNIFDQYEQELFPLMLQFLAIDAKKTIIDFGYKVGPVKEYLRINKSPELMLACKDYFAIYEENSVLQNAIEQQLRIK